MAKEYEHIFVTDLAKSEQFTSTKSGGGKPNIPIRNRDTHAAYLTNKFQQIKAQIAELKEETTALSLPAREGTYLEFESNINAELITKSLEDSRAKIRLLNVKTVTQNENQVVKATVYIPKGKESVFVKKIEEYLTQDVLSKDKLTSKPKNDSLIRSIEDVKLAILESFWPESEKGKIPDNVPKWCEVWLRVDDDLFESQVCLFTELLTRNQIQYKPNALQFPERGVLLILANRENLNTLILESDQLAEFRIGQEVAGYWLNESNAEQTEWATDLLNRLEIIESDVTVCILDSGVNNGHILLNPILSDENCLSVNSDWGTDDRTESNSQGHGTLMAGLVGYRNLQAELESQDSTIITHKLCSVKILPHRGNTPKELWGDVTHQAVLRAEIQNPEKVLLYCMAVTASDDVDRGKPSSWSGTVDKVSFGDKDTKRLFIISGGNVVGDTNWNNYPDSNLSFSVQNPAQSWNALTIGAYTDKVHIQDTAFADSTRLAPVGGLSPFSSTSFIWDKKKWPIKPEVLFEGGNVAKKNSLNIGAHEDLSLLTTAKDFTKHQFINFNATSAATAQASWLAAKLAYLYPQIWPETVRALIVHSANWNETLKRQFNIISRSQHKDLLRIAGYGIPDINRALHSFENGLTFVAQESIQPYIKEGNSFKTNQMHFYEFPWPKDLLLSLGEIEVKLRITLSYFIEPSPGEIGWKDKYRYQSYGFRFDLNHINESEEEFKKRINKAAREEEEEIEKNPNKIPWFFGKNSRDVGSIHSDIWEGTAADISDCNMIAVYPVIGWWRERHNEKRYNSKCRYSLVVSLDTPSESIELYSTVKAMIQIPVEISVTNPE
jgi:hypothetical protein